MPPEKFTRKATTPTKKRQWNSTYQSVKSQGGSPGKAIRIANAAVKNNPSRKGKK